VKRLLCVAAFLAGAGAATALADPDATPYAKRLQILKALAVRYPGQVEASRPYGKYGLWAGIVVQTTWQERSRRDRIPLWGIVNYQLSVEPSRYEALLRRADPHADAQTVCALSLAPDVCRGWTAYLIGARKPLPPATLLALLWHAHTTAIVHALRSERARFDGVRTTVPERRFWAGWIEIVFLLEAAHFPTDGATSARASALLMPRCSPLGAPGCEVTPRSLGRAFPFVSFLVARRSSIDRALAEYRTLRENPNALRLLAFTDPALSAALKLYLAVAR
jgi:hypothetical protein